MCELLKQMNKHFRGKFDDECSLEVAVRDFNVETCRVKPVCEDLLKMLRGEV